MLLRHLSVLHEFELDSIPSNVAEGQWANCQKNLNYLFNLAKSATGAERAAVVAFDGGQQHVVYAHGLAVPAIPDDPLTFAGCTTTPNPLIVTDVGRSEIPSREFWQKQGIDFIAAHPLQIDNSRVIGALYLFGDEPSLAGPYFEEQLAQIAALTANTLKAAVSEAVAAATQSRLLNERERREILGRQIERLSHIGAWALELDTDELTWSDRVYEIHGLPVGDPITLEQAIGVFVERDREIVSALLERAVSNGEAYSFEADIVRPDGEIRHIKAAGDVEHLDGEPKRLTGIVQDLTDVYERQAVQDWLLEIISHARDAIVVYDSEERIVFWNRQAERTFGWSRDEAIGRDVVDLLQIDTNDHEMRHQRMLSNGSWSGRAVYKSRSGLNITMLAHKSLIHGKGGMPDGVLVVYQDISEKMVLSDRMQTATRLDAIGQLTGGIAHDFNNLLTVIMGSADLLKLRLKDNEAALKLVDMNRGAAERGRNLVSQLLSFARRQALDTTATDVAALVDGAKPLIERAIGEQYHLSVEIEPDLWAAEIDPGKLDSALMNLCINARDACDPGVGRISVDVRNVVIDDTYVASQTDGLEGEFIVLSVSDNGCGMSPEVVQRAIEPFYSTKNDTSGKGGSGLGLSMTYGFVKQSGGSLQIYSEEGAGTTVRLYLPRSYHKAEDTKEHSEVQPSRPLRILVVEDSPRVRENSVAMLEALHHEPVTVSTAREALDLLETQHATFDLLFTDVVLPNGMSGFDLAKIARRRWPDLPVLFCSGYSHGALDGDDAILARGKMLNKPYSLVELSQGLAGLTTLQAPEPSI